MYRIVSTIHFMKQTQTHPPRHLPQNKMHAVYKLMPIKSAVVKLN